jgi:hypothetical protein
MSDHPPAEFSFLTASRMVELESSSNAGDEVVKVGCIEENRLLNLGG